MINNQTKCGIIYETIMMRAGDDKQMINYEWPKNVLMTEVSVKGAEIDLCSPLMTSKLDNSSKSLFKSAACIYNNLLKKKMMQI